MKNLSYKHEKFCYHYVHNGNQAKKAYKEVYPNCSDATAEVNASKLLKKTDVRSFLDKLQNTLRKECLLSIEERCSLLSKMALGLEEEIKVVGYEEGKQKREAFPLGAKTRMEAIDLLNKMEGVYSSTVNVKASGSVDVTTKLEWAKDLIGDIVDEQDTTTNT